MTAWRLLAAPVVGLALVIPSASGAGAPGAGSAGIGDPVFPRAGNGGYDVQHYDLSLRYLPATGGITARARVHARATQRLTSFHLDLHGLTVRRVRVGGERAAFTRRGDELVVTPATALAPGSRFVVGVAYGGVPQTYIDADGAKDGWVPTSDGAVVVNEPVGAMTVLPVNNHPRDKATWRVSLNVPSGRTGVSNGRLVSRTDLGGRSTWVWRTRDQMATYLMTATIGRFTAYRATAEDGTPIRTYVDPQLDGPAAQRSVRTTRTVMGALTDWFGPYPFEASGAIIDRAPLGYALEVQTRPVYTEVPSTLLQVHELAHQWFGNDVSPSSWQHIWLNEGFATYAEWLWASQRHPGLADRLFSEYHALPASDSLWRPAPARPGDARHLFGEPVYVRGALAVHALRMAVGDHDFFRICRAWVRVHSGSDADTADLRRLAERISGAELGTLFRDWVWRDGRPTGY